VADLWWNRHPLIVDDYRLCRDTGLAGNTHTFIHAFEIPAFENVAMTRSKPFIHFVITGTSLRIGNELVSMTGIAITHCR
jgi:hypothetical protein